MAKIQLKTVTTDFPVYGLQKSLRRALLGRMLGSMEQRDENKHIIVRALDNLSFTLKDGDRLGLVGHNGAGKSTLLRVLGGIYLPSYGELSIEGRISTLFNTSPGIDMDDTGYENIYTCGLFLGMNKEEIKSKIPEIENFAELGDYLSLPVRTYSTGMLMRLGFAVATSIDPEILLLDEGIGAGDARFTERARERVSSLITRSRILVLASHSDALIKEMCNRVILLDHGKLVADGDPDTVIEQYHEMQKNPQQPRLAVEEDVEKAA